MKYCAQCGTELDENTRFCSSCGASVTTREEDREKHRQLLDNMYRMLKYERRCWLIFGIVFTVLCLLYFVAAALFFAIGIFSEEVPVAIVGSVYLLIPLLYAPIAVVNFVMVKKTSRYQDEMYFNIGPTVKRCGSVGMIVFAYLFNTIALIFIIINFVRTKTNKADFQAIEREQLAQRQGSAF
ncbi:MAG: zinc-ribbon domain-containing protein [Clostridiales bacterium]|nr:zinc-ribbon domain-containing protein [Clostridiales bacterium]